MGIKMVEYVAYLIYFHLPSEKRSSIIHEMIMGLDFSDMYHALTTLCNLSRYRNAIFWAIPGSEMHIWESKDWVRKST